MDKFDDGSQKMAFLALRAERGAHEQQQRRPKPFAARGNQILGEGPDKFDFRIEVLPNHAVELSKLVGNGGKKTVGIVHFTTGVSPRRAGKARRRRQYSEYGKGRCADQRGCAKRLRGTD